MVGYRADLDPSRTVGAAVRASGEVFEGCHVEWLDWSDGVSNPRPQWRVADGVRAWLLGKDAVVELHTGEMFRRQIGHPGFSLKIARGYPFVFFTKVSSIFGGDGLFLMGQVRSRPDDQLLRDLTATRLAIAMNGNDSPDEDNSRRSGLRNGMRILRSEAIRRGLI